MRLNEIALALCFACLVGCGDPIPCPPVPIVEKGAFRALEAELVGITTQIIVDKNREVYPRQCYFGDAHIDFGNYYNHRYHFSHDKFLASGDTIFDNLDELERERLLELSKEMLASGIVNAEYSYGFRRYLFLVTQSGEYEEQVFMMATEGLDLSALERNKILVVLCMKNSYVFFRQL